MASPVVQPPKFLRDFFYDKIMVENVREGTMEEVLDIYSFRFLNIVEDLEGLPYINHTVKAGEENKPWLISFILYGSTEFWWIICQVNGIIDPFTELGAGVELKIPTRSAVESIFMDLKRQDRKGQISSLKAS